MNDGTWILLMLAMAAAAGCLGYLLGRRNSSQQAEISRLESELQAARQRADTIKAGLDSHFEQSAILFGTLAKDYRAFLDHFSETASTLGISEDRTEELLGQVARPLLARSAGAAPEPPATNDEAGSHADSHASAAPPTAGERNGASDLDDPDSVIGDIPSHPAGAAQQRDATAPAAENALETGGTDGESSKPPATQRD